MFLVVVIVAIGVRLLSNGSEPEQPEAAPDPGPATASEAAPDETAEGTVPFDPQGDSEGSLAVLSLGAITPDPEGEWESFLTFGSDWSPFAETDTRAIPAGGYAYGFLGIGALDQTVAEHTSGDPERTLQEIAEVIAAEFITTVDDIELSEVEVRDVELDGREAALGEFTLEWGAEIADGDTSADYAVVITELEDGAVFAGFLGLFASQSEVYDDALDTLLETTFLERSEPDPDPGSRA